MNKRSLKNVTALFVSMFLLVTVMGGCKKTEGTSNSANNSSESNAPVPIRWVRAANEQDPAKDRILIELQKKTNTKLDIVSIPWDQFPNKLNIMMSSGEQIDIANCDPGKTLNEWANNGLVLSFDDYLKDGKYPYVSAVVNSEVYKGLKINGKAYYKPLGLCPQQWGYLIRQDWLDNLGLKVPTNIDELYNVIKSFQQNDPDKNGKNDTYGWYARAGGKDDVSGSFGFMLRAYSVNAGTGNWVELPDGTVTRYEASDAAKQGAEFARKIVKDGLINKDWLSLKSDAAQGPESDDFAAGKYGIAATSVPDVFVQKLQKVNPSAKVTYLPPIEGVNGVPANSGHTGGYWWGNVIPKTCKNPEKVLELLDYSLTKEGRELTEFGIKDIHFTDVKEENNSRVYTINKPECDKDWDTKKNGYLYPLTWGGLNYYEYVYIPIKEYNFNYDEAFKNVQPWLPEDMAKGQFANWQSMNTKYAVASPLMNVMDDKLLGDQQKLSSTFGEGWLKAVVGNGDFDKAWSDMTSKWLKAGGDAIIKAGNEYYKNNK